jgi:hypothetical protein
MLQPIPARAFFRLLEILLGVAAIGAGGYLAFISTAAWSWTFASFVVLGPVIALFGVLAIIHAWTGCLPEWVVGDGGE